MSLDRVTLIRRVTRPVSADVAMALVDGYTDKPGGVNPGRMLGLGLDNGRTYRLGNVPLEWFRANEEGERYDGTVDLERAVAYSKLDPTEAPPVLALLGRSGMLSINDGGHRISGARLRGDLTIKALIPLPALAVTHSFLPA